MFGYACCLLPHCSFSEFLLVQIITSYNLVLLEELEKPYVASPSCKWHHEERSMKYSLMVRCEEGYRGFRRHIECVMIHGQLFTQGTVLKFLYFLWLFDIQPGLSRFIAAPPVYRYSKQGSTCLTSELWGWRWPTTNRISRTASRSTPQSIFIT